ncbi:unnamed protein product [Effrenium voratum]|nr:unnamed protein product [Effrenium voratum]
MYFVFYRAEAFNHPIGSWNTSAVTNMYLTFLGAKAFDQPVDLWDLSALTSHDHKFHALAPPCEAGRGPSQNGLTCELGSTPQLAAFAKDVLQAPGPQRSATHVSSARCFTTP